MRTPALLLLLSLHLCAVSVSAQGISAECTPAQDLLKQAETAARQNDWQTAANRYWSASQIAPGCVEALVNLGVTYNQLNQTENAVKAFKDALAKNPQLFAAHLNLGITYFRASQFDLAKESLRNASKLNPEHTQARQLLVLSLTALEQFKEAAAELEQLNKITPPDAATMIALGQIYLRLKQYRDASRGQDGFMRAEFFEQIGRPGHFAIVETWRDQKAFDAGLNNTTTARGLLVLMQKIATGQAVNKTADAEMAAILKRQHFNDGIPAGLPAGTVVGHKTGTITKIHNDAAIVYAPKPFVLVVLVRGIQDQKVSAALIASISHEIWEAAEQ